MDKSLEYFSTYGLYLDSTQICSAINKERMVDFDSLEIGRTSRSRTNKILNDRRTSSNPLA
jgi:hypothetical protein